VDGADYGRCFDSDYGRASRIEKAAVPPNALYVEGRRAPPGGSPGAIGELRVVRDDGERTGIILSRRH
jgi:hypothetical protein